MQLLQARVAPIPRDLNDPMLAEFVAARTVAEDPSPRRRSNHQSAAAAFSTGGVLRNGRASSLATSPQISPPSSILIFP